MSQHVPLRVLVAALALAIAGWSCRGEGGNGATARATPTPAAPPPILVEIDTMAGQPAIADSLTIGNRTVSVHDIFAAAGLDVRIVRDQTDLPAAESVRLADLHAMMQRFRSVAVPPGAARVHLLVVASNAERPGDLGVMFDFGNQDVDDIPREGFAVFAPAHDGLPGGREAEMLLTLVHELAHCLNLHHSDWEGGGFDADSTIEGYSSADSVRWALSERSRRHLRSHPLREVRFGPGNLRFGQVTASHLEDHQGDPRESWEVFDAARADAAARAGRTAVLATSLARSSARVLAPASTPLRLELQAAKASWSPGEPVTVAIGLHNTGAQPVSVRPLLDPAYRFLNLEVRAPGQEEFRPFRPLLLREARGAASGELAAGGSLHEEVKVFFGADGWMFSSPGRYAVRADYPAGPNGDRIASPVLELEVVAPAADSASRAARMVLGKQQGLYLFFEGGDHLERGAAQLRALVSEQPDAAQSAAVRLALGVGALAPTLGAANAPPEAQAELAKGYLAGVLQADLPPATVLRAQARLAAELEADGQMAAARRVRTQTVEELRDEETVAAQVRAFRAGRLDPSGVIEAAPER